MANFEPIYTANGKQKQKRKFMYDLHVREAFEIRKHNSGPGKGLNEDHGSYLRTDMWDPVLSGMT